MKMPFILLGICCALILSSCKLEKISEPSEKTNENIEIQSLDVSGVENDVSLGQSMTLTPVLELNEEGVGNDVEYTWTIQKEGKLVEKIISDALDDWQPTEPGLYKITLQANVEDSQKELIIYIQVLQPILVSNDGLIEKLKELKANLPGYYLGTMETPWTEPYQIALHIDENGNYSAYNVDTDAIPAFYYGTDNDSPAKYIQLDNISVGGKASGTILIFFEHSTENIDQIKNLSFSEDYSELSFEMFHHNQYGPLKASLNRIAESELPPRPLPTPNIILAPNSDTSFSAGVVESMEIIVSPVEGLEPICQWLDSHPNIITSFNANHLWDPLAPSFNCNENNIVPYPEFKGKLILARFSDGTRFGGVSAQMIIFGMM